MAEQSSRIGPRTVLARFQREGPRKRRPNEPRWITEEIILLEFAKPCGIHVSFPQRFKQQRWVDTYLQVINAETTELANERNTIDILRRRMEASVLLIKVLGGGWDARRMKAY